MLLFLRSPTPAIPRTSQVDNPAAAVKRAPPFTHDQAQVTTSRQTTHQGCHGTPADQPRPCADAWPATHGVVTGVPIIMNVPARPPWLPDVDLLQQDAASLRQAQQHPAMPRSLPPTSSQSAQQQVHHAPKLFHLRAPPHLTQVPARQAVAQQVPPVDAPRDYYARLCLPTAKGQPQDNCMLPQRNLAALDALQMGNDAVSTPVPADAGEEEDLAFFKGLTSSTSYDMLQLLELEDGGDDLVIMQDVDLVNGGALS